MQASVLKLLELGKLPKAEEADADSLQKFQKLLLDVSRPVDNQEAAALAELLGPDECYGLAWTIIHIIEESSGWPSPEGMGNVPSEWIEMLSNRSIHK